MDKHKKVRGKKKQLNPRTLFNKNCRALLRSTSRLIAYSLVFYHLNFSHYAHAAPDGGMIVGGTGQISATGLTTTIKQNSSSLAINWNSYNLSANEIVNYLQPDSSSIALNRILGSNASQIYGQINSNGHVVLVNPNGIFFGETSSINVGGLIASGLDISPVDFMNSNYVFNSIDGTSGAVINSGLLNASLGGSITLLGKQVENLGLISANLGAINLAAGKEAILSFDNEGLVGIQITKEILQDELGVDPALLNSGEVTAESGRILLTASQSKDVFSQAVNSGDIEQAISVVVHEDGSFTLGGGADVVNTGTIDVSSVESGKSAGQIVILGENITSSGVIAADASDEFAGQIEIHSQDTTMLTQDSLTTARTEISGSGGAIKVLGDKVGLFDQSVVDASGANGGGEVLIGGDLQGLNENIRNADFIYLGEGTQVKTDAINNGDGGKLITFANDTAKIYGDLFSRGGSNSGNGGFIETSGLKSFQILKTPDITAVNGTGGEWLIDPNDIRIVSGGGNININDANPFVSTDDGALLDVDLLTGALSGGATVTIATASAGVNSELGNITLSTNLDYTGTGNSTLTLNAHNNIDINNSNITGGASDSLNLSLNANSNGSATGSGDVLITNAEIDTNGGTFTVSGVNFTSTRGGNNSDTIDTDGGAVTLNMTGDIDISSEIITNGGTFTVTSSANTFDNSDADGDILAGSGSVSITTSGDDGSGVGINLGRIDTTSTLSVISNGGSIIQTSSTSDELRITGLTTLSSSSNITLNNEDNRFGTVATTTAVDLILVDDNSIELGNITTAGTLNVTSGDRNDAAISQSSGTALVIGGDATFSTADTNTNNSGNDVILENSQNEFGGAVYVTADMVSITDSTALLLGEITIDDTNNETSTFESTGGNITQVAGTAIDNDRTGAVTVLDAGASDIILDAFVANDSALTNDFTDIIVISANNVTLTDNDWIGLDDMDIAGDLTVSAGLNVTSFDTYIFNTSTVSVVNVGGVTSLTSRNNSGTNYDINLNSVNNDFNDVTIVNAEDVTLVDGTGSINLQSTNTIALIDVTANGNAGSVISNSGSLSVIGSSTFTILSGQSIDLSNTGNSFTIDPNFLTSNGGNIANLSVVDITDLTLQDNLSITGNLTAIGNNLTLQNTTVGGNLTATATLASGLINQTGVIDVNGTSDLTTTDGTITLDTSSNNFIQAVSLTAQTAAVRDANSIILGNVTIGNGLTITAEDGSITQLATGTGLDISGTALFDSTNGYIDLASNGVNDFQGDVDLTTSGTDASTVQITDGNDITLINVNVGASNADLIVNATLINLDGDVTTSGGDATFNAPVTLQSAAITPTLNTVNTGTGGINFNSTLDGTNIREQSLTLTARNVNFVGAVGTTRLGDLTITATGDVNALSNSITANSINVVSSNSFSSGDVNTTGADNSNAGDVAISAVTAIVLASIDTQGGLAAESDGFNGGAVTLNGQSITVGAINSSGSNAVAAVNSHTGGVAGDVTITASEASGPAAILLNDDIIAIGGDGINGGISGASKVAQLSLVSNSSGSVTINYAGDFTSGLNITGDVSSDDTLLAPNRTNNWNITGTDSGELNRDLAIPLAGVIFSSIENLTGNEGIDIFQFTDVASSISGNIDGGAGLADTIDLSNLAIVDVDLSSTGNFTGIETYTGNGFDSTLTGENELNTWIIGGLNSGDVSNTNGTINFIDFTDLVGNSGVDNFILTGDGSTTGVLTGTITGGTSGDSLTVINTTAAVTWDITSLNQGGVTGLNGGIADGFFSIENLTGGDQDDTFAFQAAGDIEGTINAGLGTDSIDLSNLATVTFDLANALTGRLNFEEVIGNWNSVTSSGDSTINGENLANTWTIDGDNTGLIGGLRFIDFNNLTGGSVQDIFNFTTDTATINGLIDGLGSTVSGSPDTINLTAISAANSITVQLDSIAGDNSAEGDAVNKNGFLDVVNIGQINANTNLSNTLRGGATVNTWTITSDRTGSVNTTGFTGFSILTGGAEVDNYSFNNTNLTDIYTIDGGLGDNLITGSAIDVSWEISGLNSGNISDTDGALDGNTNISSSFSNIQNLTGSTNSDVFIFNSGSSLSGTTDGGNGNDEIINQLTGNTTWNITGVNQGDVAGIGNFTRIENLTGNAADDMFIYADGGDISGVIDGGAQTGQDIIDYSNVSGAVSLNLATDIIIDIEQVIGNNDSTLTASNITNNWIINGNNEGSLNGLAFVDFNNLTGGSGIDTFNVSATGTVTGQVNGAAGNDVVNVTLNTIENGGFVFDGGVDNDTINIDGGNSNVTALYESQGAGLERLTYTESANNYAVSFSGTETINDSVMAVSLTINGSANADSINLGTNRFNVNNTSNINYSNKTNLVVNGAAGNDVIDLFENFTLTGGQLTLTAEVITDSNNAVLAAETLVLDTVNSVGTSANPLSTDIANLNLVNINGDVFITDVSGLSINQFSTINGLIELTAQTGDIQNNVVLNENADLNLIVLNGDIMLTEVIQLSSLNLNADNITINNGGNALSVNDVTAGNVVNISSQGFDLTGDMSAGNIHIDADTGLASITGDILSSSELTLTATGVTLNGLLTSGGNAILDASTGDINLNSSVSVLDTADLSLTANSIIQNGNITSQAGNIELTANDAITMASASSVISDTGNIIFQAVNDIHVSSVSAQTGNVSLTSSTGEIIDANGNSTNFIAGTLNLVTSSGIGNNDSIETRVSSMNILNSGSGDIRLLQTGSVEFIALQNVSSSGLIDIRSDGDFYFNPGSVVVNRDNGTLFMSTSSGSFLGKGLFNLQNADITANVATFFALSGTFGTTVRPLVLDVPVSGSVLIDSRTSSIRFYPQTPDDLVTTGIDIGALGVVSAVAGEQLVEIESLGDIDPAIFTDLQNYSKAETSIRMPRDQLFEDELEEENQQI